MEKTIELTTKMISLFKFPIPKTLIFVLLVVFIECYERRLERRPAGIASVTTMQHLVQKHKRDVYLNTICPTEKTNQKEDTAFMQYPLLIADSCWSKFIK